MPTFWLYRKYIYASIKLLEAFGLHVDTLVYMGINQYTQVYKENYSMDIVNNTYHNQSRYIKNLKKEVGIVTKSKETSS